MRFEPLALPGVFVVRAEPVHDQRGYFARTWCRLEFEQHDINFCPVQSALSFNPGAGTLRGLHFQAPPHEETKLVSCLTGSIFDVLVDLRPESPTLWQWTSVRLSAGEPGQLFVPHGIAHGYLTIHRSLLADCALTTRPLASGGRRRRASSASAIEGSLSSREMRWEVPRVPTSPGRKGSGVRGVSPSICGFKRVSRGCGRETRGVNRSNRLTMGLGCHNGATGARPMVN
jgi:dTDP-4-dehydrorhamnose 3,5-epimerase